MEEGIGWLLMNTNVNPNFAVIVPLSLVKVSNLDKVHGADYFPCVLSNAS